MLALAKGEMYQHSGVTRGAQELGLRKNQNQAREYRQPKECGAASHLCLILSLLTRPPGPRMAAHALTSNVTSGYIEFFCLSILLFLSPI